MEHQHPSLRREIKSLYARAVASLVALTMVSVAILLIQINVSTANRQLSDLQFSVVREARLVNATMEKFRFVVKYQDERKDTDSFFQSAMRGLAKDFEDLQDNAKTRVGLIADVESNFTIRYFADFKPELISIPPSDINLYEWAEKTFSIDESGQDLQFTRFVGPLEMGLLNRESAVARNTMAFGHLDAMRERIEKLQTWIYFTTFIAIVIVLVFMIFVVLLPAIRQVLRAERETNVKNRIRESLSQFSSRFHSNAQISTWRWEDFSQNLMDTMNRELPELKFDLFEGDANEADMKAHEAHQISVSGVSEGDRELMMSITYDEKWQFARGELRALAEKVIAFAMLVRNISLRLHVESDRDVYFGYLDAIVANSPMGLALFDVNGTLLLSNSIFNDELETTLEKTLDPASLSNIAARARKRHHTELHSFFENNHEKTFEQRSLNKTLRWQRVSLNEGGTLIAVQDITSERKQLINAEHNRRLEALGKISSGISHDVNNFLAVILNNIELARSSNGYDGEDDYLDRAESACLAASKVNEQLLSYSRRQPLMPEAVDTHELVQQIKSYTTQAGRERDVDYILSNTRSIWADPSSLASALLNIVKNAVDATLPNQKIRVEMRDAHLDGNQHAVEIIVTDEGAGFSRDPSECLEPFFTTKESGSGLGLAAVEGFVAQSKGTLEIGNNNSMGAFVVMKLPASQRLPVKKAPKPIAQSTHRDVSILVVDDNTQILRTIDLVLRRHGYHTISVESLREASEVLQAQTSAFSLLITDIVLNDGTGFDVAKEFLKVMPHGQIIYISGHPCAEFERELEITPGYFLTKPFHLSDLDVKVTEALSVSCVT